ncbi:MAG TPA: GNAT family N-acetyltransferase [Solirubrobacteraceae bacterium]
MASAVLASAFHEDPLWGLWAFPQEADRLAGLPELMRFWVQGALPHGWVRIGEHAEAVAVLLPPGAAELSDGETAEFEAFVGRTLGPRAPELIELFERFERHHPSHPSHYYLSLWGTHRDSAGRGLGAALLDDCLAQIDQEHAPVYLESTNPVNVPRYEALGFAATGRFTAPHGPTITSMWREAR